MDGERKKTTNTYTKLKYTFRRIGSTQQALRSHGNEHSRHDSLRHGKEPTPELTGLLKIQYSIILKLVDIAFTGKCMSAIWRCYLAVNIHKQGLLAHASKIYSLRSSNSIAALVKMANRRTFGSWLQVWIALKRILVMEVWTWQAEFAKVKYPNVTKVLHDRLLPADVMPQPTRLWYNCCQEEKF